MGAGISKEQERQAIYRSLRRIERELTAAGVVCQYGSGNDRTLPRGLRRCVFGPDSRNIFYLVHYGRTARASNGEAFGNCIVEVNGEHYSFLDAGIGVRRIKALYGNEENRKGWQETDLAWMLVQVNDALRQEHGTGSDPNMYDVFLHDENGNRVAKNHGMVFCYNEMRDGKPMLRLGTCETDYVEFAPGMSVRRRDGTMIVQRPL